MRKFFVLLSIIIATNGYSQITRSNLDEMKPAAADKAMESDGYKVDNGWCSHYAPIG